MTDVNAKLRSAFLSCANAIREKTGETGTMKISEMAQKIDDIGFHCPPPYIIDENGCVQRRGGNLRFDMKSISEYGMMECFCYCSNLSSVSFPNLTSIGYLGMSECFYYCSKLAKIHFRADAQSVVESTEGYSNKFGAHNATIYFDL